MKKITLMLMMITIQKSFAQSITASPDTVEGSYADYELAHDYIYVNNNSGVDITINFTLLSNTCVSNGWYNTLCSSYTCYPGVPSSGTLGTIPNGGQGYFAYQCEFDGISGYGEMRIRVYENGNPSNADTLTYLYHAYSTAGLGNTGGDPDINIYPNPVTDFINIQLTNVTNSGTITIANAEGKKCLSQKIDDQIGPIDLSNLPKGIYFITIKTSIKEVTKRVIIQ